MNWLEMKQGDPKSRKVLLLASALGSMVSEPQPIVGYWNERESSWRDITTAGRPEIDLLPTHWAELLPPPSTQKSDD